MNKENNNSHSFIKSSLIVLLCGLIVKLIGLFGKILTSRILGIEGIKLYTLCYPTLLLFISISSFSMNTTVSRLTSVGIATKKYSPTKILSESIKQSLFISSICSLIYIISIRFISIHLLKEELLFLPLLFGTILIPLVGISDALRGYYNGLKDTSSASLSLLLEQLTRIASSLIIILLTYKNNIVIATIGMVLSLSIGELSSILYCLIKLKNNKVSYNNTFGERKLIFSTALPLTLSRLISSITYFIEPILYTSVLSYCLVESSTIHEYYTMIESFVLPLLTLLSFIPLSLSNILLPLITRTYSLNDTNKTNKYINKIFFYLFYSCAFSLSVIYFNSSEVMNLMFNTTKGAELAKYSSIFFLSFYFNMIIQIILQAFGQNKLLFINSLITHIIKLLLILVLSFIPFIRLNSILISTLIVINVSTFSLLYKLFKLTSYKISKKLLLSYALYIIFIIAFNRLLLLLSINYLICILCSLIITIIIVLSTKKQLD